MAVKPKPKPKDIPVGNVKRKSGAITESIRPKTLKKRPRDLAKEFGDLEFRWSLDKELIKNPIARLGFENTTGTDKVTDFNNVEGYVDYIMSTPTLKTKVSNDLQIFNDKELKEELLHYYSKGLTAVPELFDNAFYIYSRNTPSEAKLLGDMAVPKNKADEALPDDIFVDTDVGSPRVWAHEMTHRGFDRLIEYKNQIGAEKFGRKYGQQALETLEQIGKDPDKDEFYTEYFDFVDDTWNYPNLENMGRNNKEKFLDQNRLKNIENFQRQGPGVLGKKNPQFGGVGYLIQAAEDILKEVEPPRATPYGHLSFMGRLRKKLGFSKGGMAEQMEMFGYTAEGAQQEADKYIDKDAAPAKDITFKDAAKFVAELTPVIGDAMAAKEVYDELQKDDPNYFLAGALGGAAIIGLIPGIGDAAASAIRAGARKSLDVAKRVEVDPDAVGTMGGNIRLKPNVKPLTTAEKESLSADFQRVIDPSVNDNPDIFKAIFLDDEYAREILAELRSPTRDITGDPAKLSEVQSLRNEIYSLTQEGLKDLPEEVTVYRYGPLNERDGVTSFTLNPLYGGSDPSLHLPWVSGKNYKLESYTVKKSDILAAPDLIRDFGEAEIIIRNDAVKKLKSFAKGGTVMNEQMQMAFMNEGGLTDDGMDVDPVSGNDIPAGSMAEEVRDDIPAQLSDGEYVVPADVVRYYGVKFFEDLRERAKIGLQEMEMNGRIGGEPVPAGGPTDGPLTSEEMAVLEELGMAEGGVVDVYKQQTELYTAPNPAIGNTVQMYQGGEVRGYNPGGDITQSQQAEKDFYSSGAEAQQAGFVGLPLGATVFGTPFVNQRAFTPVELINTKPPHDIVMATTQQLYDEYINKGYVKNDGSFTPPVIGDSGGDGGGGGGEDPPKPEGWKKWLESADFNSREGLEKFVESLEYDPTKDQTTIKTLGATVTGGLLAGATTALGSSKEGLNKISNLRAAALIAKAQGFDDLAEKYNGQVASIIKDAPKILDYLDDVLAPGTSKANFWAKEKGFKNIQEAIEAGVTPTTTPIKKSKPKKPKVSKTGISSGSTGKGQAPAKFGRFDSMSDTDRANVIKDTTGVTVSGEQTAAGAGLSDPETGDTATSSPGGAFNKGGLMTKGKKKKKK